MRTAGQFDAVVRVSFKGQEVSGLSIMGLMMLAAGIGSEIELSCSGRQATDAMAALSALVEGKFGESNVHVTRQLTCSSSPVIRGRPGGGRPQCAAGSFQIMIFAFHRSPLMLSPSRPPPYDGGGV